MEKIISIKEESFKLSDDDWNVFDGYVIQTDSQLIKVGVSNSQNCCENWGYLTTNDNIEEFIGSDLLSISEVDESLNKKPIPETEYLDEGNVMFVNFETSNGTLQLVCYNSHNGYYGHSAVVISKQLTVDKYL